MNRQDIAAHIRNAKPTRLKVVLTDDTEKGVAMPRGRNKADKAAGIIDDMPWASVYMLDGRGDAIGVFHRDDSMPAADLKDLTATPTADKMGQIAVAMAAVHRVATESAVELVTKVRATHKDEMGVVFDSLAKALTAATERAAGFEQRANDLMADNDELRAEIAELRDKQTPSPSDVREDRIMGMLASELGMGGVGNTNAPGGGGVNGANGAAAG